MNVWIYDGLTSAFRSGRITGESGDFVSVQVFRDRGLGLDKYDNKIPIPDWSKDVKGEWVSVRVHYTGIFETLQEVKAWHMNCLQVWDGNIPVHIPKHHPFMSIPKSGKVIYPPDPHGSTET